MPSLVDQIFMQAQLGTGPPPSDAFARGIALGQQQRQLNMAERELVANLAMMRMREMEHQQQTEIRTEHLRTAYEARENYNLATKAFNDMRVLVDPILRTGDVDQARRIATAQGMNNSYLLTDPRYKAFDDQLQSMQQERTRKLAAETTAPVADLQTRVVRNEKTGQEETYVRTGPNSWSKMGAGGIYFEHTSPTGERSLMVQGQPPPSGVGQVAANEAEKKLMATERSVALIQESLPMITNETVGPRGMLREITEKVGNIITPGSIPPVATAARQTFRTTAQNLYNSLKADSQINKLEAAAIKSIADITDLLEAPDTAKTAYQTLMDLSALQAAIQAHQLGRVMPNWALQAMSKDQAERAYNRGNLTEFEATRWFELHP